MLAQSEVIEEQGAAAPEGGVAEQEEGGRSDMAAEGREPQAPLANGARMSADRGVRIPIGYHPAPSVRTVELRWNVGVVTM